MNFDVYFPFRTKQGKLCPGVNAKNHDWHWIVNELSKRSDIKEIVTAIRNGGDRERKKELPAVCWVGTSTTGRRLAEVMEPTQFVMVDVDHCQDAASAVEKIKAAVAADEELQHSVAIIHYTPSMGIRIVFRATQDYPTLKEHMEWLNTKLDLGQYGDFDTAVKDFSRLSFLPSYEDFMYVNDHILNDEEPYDIDPLKKEVIQKDVVVETPAPQKTREGSLFDNTSVAPFTEEEEEKYKNLEYRGTLVSIIIEKYVEKYGEPSSGEIHNFYNGLVKNFRSICDNNKRALLYLLPRFGHTIDECWSQIVSITRVNTLSSLEKSFYYFLKDNGFYQPKGASDAMMKEYLLGDKEDEKLMPPYLPPVFRELVSIAPPDFVVPAIAALLPIVGTLTSYLRAVYPFDNREHTTSFFTVIYAPPGTGKGFVERFIDLLFEDLKLRDFVQSERENIYLRILQRKGANESAPDMPHTSLRIIPAKNSEAEFLQKQRDNHGYHMFTYAAEMDSWAKGVRAAGGNKDDMIRIAWDNGEYGQQFKSANTFKGMVRLYWNVLITGTIAQVESYFKNVENGLVTRCTFCSIENQEFADAPIWRPLNKRAKSVIRQFMARCDERTYTEPCTLTISDIESVSDDDFDKSINWRFQFKERQDVNMDWVMPTIKKFESEQQRKAALDIDRARDVFRRRVGVRGFRLGLMCYGLWQNPRQTDLEKCCTFIYWWMNQDIESMLKLWGARYNEQADQSPVLVQRTVFDNLPSQFTKNDIYVTCLKQGIKTPVRRIVFDWKKLGYIIQLDKETYKKKS